MNIKYPSLLSIGLCMVFNTSLPEAKRITINNKEFAVSISQQQIQTRVQELGKQITADYAGKKPIFIGVLNGAFIFLSDLIRAVDLECSVDFIKISSYGNDMTTSGNAVLTKDLSCDITGRHVIIVEDIVESGLSLQFAREYIKNCNPASIRTATLLHKNIAALEFTVDYVGFDIEPEFVIGYGLDYAQAARNLNDIYALVK